MVHTISPSSLLSAPRTAHAGEMVHTIPPASLLMAPGTAHIAGEMMNTILVVILEGLLVQES